IWSFSFWLLLVQPLYSVPQCDHYGICRTHYPYVPAPPGKVPPCAKPGSTFCEKLDHYPSCLRLITNAPWYIRNSTLHTDLQVPDVTTTTLHQNYLNLQNTFVNHRNPLVQQILQNYPPHSTNRRLKRKWHSDLRMAPVTYGPPPHPGYSYGPPKVPAISYYPAVQLMGNVSSGGYPDRKYKLPVQYLSPGPYVFATYLQPPIYEPDNFWARQDYN
ncbi:hypothetical protein C0J52_19171, partial [Blattella germanica]